MITLLLLANNSSVLTPNKELFHSDSVVSIFISKPTSSSNIPGRPQRFTDFMAPYSAKPVHHLCCFMTLLEMSWKSSLHFFCRVSVAHSSLNSKKKFGNKIKSVYRDFVLQITKLGEDNAEEIILSICRKFYLRSLLKYSPRFLPIHRKYSCE
jgi:hypothetical protein